MSKDIAQDDLDLFRIMEERLHDPQVRRSAELTGELLADDFIEFGSSGRVYTRAAIIEALVAEAELPTAPIVATDYRLTWLSDESALLTYRTMGSSGHALRSSIWRLTKERWQMIFHQGTKTAG